MNFLDKDKMKFSVLVVTFLLLASAFAFLPVAGAYSVSPASTSTPVAVTGATATIDYPILAAIAGATTDTRVIAVNNPSGNPGITTITISVPAGAVTASPTGSIPSYAGVPDCVAGCNAATFGAGPYSIQYTDTASSGAVILPPGATILLAINLKPETATTATGAADTFSLAASVTETGGANTVLSPITIYETTATAVTLGTPSSSSVTVGTLVTFTSSTTQTGLPLFSGISSVSAAGTPTTSPASFTSGASTTTITVNDTTAETDTFTVGGPKPNANSANGLLTNGTTGNIVFTAGTPSTITITINGHSSSHQINMTSTTFITGANIVVASADKYGNTVAPTSPLSITLAASTLKGQAAGFTVDTSYTAGASANANYPYTPSDLTTTQSLTITSPATQASPTMNYYMGPDYGATSMLSATATGVPTATSGKIMTWALSPANPVTAVQVTGGLSVQAGSAAQIEATLPVAQAGMSVYFTITTNSSGYGGLFTNGQRAIATTSFGNTTGGFAIASLSVDTTLAASATVQVNYQASPTANDTGADPTVTITTATGPLGSLTVTAYFDAAQANKAKAVAASGTVYLDVAASDAYGNSITVNSGTVQISLSATAGSLSTNTAYITATHNDITASNYQVQFVAPASGSFTITATGTYSGVSATGSKTLSIVSKSPTVVFTSVPTAVTTGVAQQVIGWANVSTGVAPTTITSLKYSLNGATNVTLAAGQATNQFTISALLATNNNIVVYATDGNGVTTSASVQVPAVAVSQTFQNASAIQKITFTNGPSAINATYTNHGTTSLTVIVVANVLNSQGAIIQESTGTITVASGATGSAYPIIQGIPSGTYTVQVTVYSLAYVTLSPTTSITVTV